MNRTQHYGLKPSTNKLDIDKNLANNNQIIQQWHNFKNIHISNFQHNPFLYQAKVCIIFYRAKITN